MAASVASENTNGAKLGNAVAMTAAKENAVPLSPEGNP
jgi:hypothetical protein